MSKTLQVGNDTFNYPSPGDKAGWGEEATAWAEAVTQALANVQGPNDVLITSATLSNNQSSVANIPNLLFNTGEVQGIEVDFFIIRSYDSGTSKVTEQGKILGHFDGTEFFMSLESSGDSGVDLTITNGGQFQYTSTNLANHVSTTIRYRGRTIDQP